MYDIYLYTSLLMCINRLMCIKIIKSIYQNPIKSCFIGLIFNYYVFGIVIANNKGVRKYKLGRNLL